LLFTAWLGAWWWEGSLEILVGLPARRTSHRGMATTSSLGWRDDHLRSNQEAASRIFFLFVRVFCPLLLLLPHACAHAAGCMAGLLQRRAFWNIP
jgi:hypothetical protein